MAGTAGRKFLALGKLVGAVGVTGLLAAGIALPAVGGLGIVARNSAQSFENQPCDVQITAPKQSSTMYAGDGKTVIAQFFSENRQVISAKQIPDIMRKAQVAIEDRRFYEHHGVDARGVLRAAVHNASDEGGRQGASTLTMQYVRNLLIEQAHDEAMAILVAHRATLDALAGALIERETVDDSELAVLFKDVGEWTGAPSPAATP